jgi:hypothetical protein
VLAAHYRLLKARSFLGLEDVLSTIKGMFFSNSTYLRCFRRFYLGDHGEFDNGYKYIVNRLKERSRQDLLIEITKHLRRVEDKPAGQWVRDFNPWSLLLLLRWSIQYGGKRYPPKPLTSRVLIKLNNKLHDLEPFHPSLDELRGEELGTYLRSLSSQQFWLQERMTIPDVARQILFYRNVNRGNPLRNGFEDETGVSPEDYIDLSLIVWAFQMSVKPRFIFSANDLTNNLKYSREVTSAFFASISGTLDDLENRWANASELMRDPVHQMKEQSPLIDTPLIRDGALFVIPCMRVLEEHIRTRVLRAATKRVGSSAAESFGKILDDYVRDGLSRCKLHLYSERELKLNFPGGKVTDYLLPFEECIVLLEVKAGDSKNKIRAYPTQERLGSDLASSAIKGIIQGLQLSERLRTDRCGINDRNVSSQYLVIVTQRELYLGPIQQAWEEFLGAAIDKEMGKASGMIAHRIPPENIFCLSIREYDLLLGALEDGSKSLPEILKSAQIADSLRATRRLTFGQHLFDMFNGIQNSHLTEVGRTWREKISKMFLQ